MGELIQIAGAVIQGEASVVQRLVSEALDGGIPPSDILYQGLVEGLNMVSQRFQNDEVFVPDVLLASRAVHAGMRVIKPLLQGHTTKVPGKIIIGTVAGDLHDIGKNLVVMFLKAKGYEVIDLGIDVSPDKFLEAVLYHEPQVLGMSALLSTTMPMMAGTIKLLERASVREKVKIIIGGGPISRDYCKSIKADGYATDARSAVELVGSLISPQSPASACSRVHSR